MEVVEGYRAPPAFRVKDAICDEPWTHFTPHMAVFLLKRTTRSNKSPVTIWMVKELNQFPWNRPNNLLDKDRYLSLGV